MALCVRVFMQVTGRVLMTVAFPLLSPFCQDVCTTGSLLPSERRFLTLLILSALSAPVR